MGPSVPVREASAPAGPRGPLVPVRLTPLVPVPDTNRDQCASLLAHNHWSRFVAGTGTKGDPFGPGSRHKPGPMRLAPGPQPLVPVCGWNRDQLETFSPGFSHKSGSMVGLYIPAREQSSALLCFFGRPWESFCGALAHLLCTLGVR